MTTVLTPHSANQSASRQRSSVNVRNVRTNSLSRLGPTAATWIVAPISIAAAAGLTVEKSRDLRGRFVWLMPDALLRKNQAGAGRRGSISRGKSIAAGGFRDAATRLSAP